MQYKYIPQSNSLDPVNKKILDQFEAWSLQAIVNFTQGDTEQAAHLFGSSTEILQDRLSKHNMKLADSELSPKNKK